MLCMYVHTIIHVYKVKIIICFIYNNIFVLCLFTPYKCVKKVSKQESKFQAHLTTLFISQQNNNNALKTHNVASSERRVFINIFLGGWNGVVFDGFFLLFFFSFFLKKLICTLSSVGRVRGQDIRWLGGS